MKCYIITIDLKDDREMSEIILAIKSYGTWGRISKYSWAIVSSNTATEIRDHIAKYLKFGETVFVIKSGKEAAWRNVIASNDWLKKYL